MSGVVVNRCDFAVGQYIGGLYRVDLVLGEGSFGKVFKVTGPGSQVYALKLLKLWEIVPELRMPLMDRFVMEFETGLIKSRFTRLAMGWSAEILLSLWTIVRKGILPNIWNVTLSTWLKSDGRFFVG